LVLADDTTKVYGDDLPAFTASYSGFVLGEGPDVLEGTLTFSTDATAITPVGNYDVAPGDLSSSNYAITFVSGTFSVTPRPIVVTADAQTKTYGDADSALTYQITNGSLVNGDSFTGVLTRAQGEAVGNYAIHQGTLALGDNYTLTYVGASLT